MEKMNYNPKARKRAKAPLYMRSPIGRRFQESNPDPEGHLLAYGRYRTKIFPEDLPEWYVEGYKDFTIEVGQHPIPAGTEKTLQ